MKPFVDAVFSQIKKGGSSTFAEIRTSYKSAKIRGSAVYCSLSSYADREKEKGEREWRSLIGFNLRRRKTRNQRCTARSTPLPSFPLFSETPPFPAVDCGFQFSLLLSTTTMALLDVNPLFGDRKEGEWSGCELQEGGGRGKRVTLLIPDRNLIDDWSCLFSSL